MIFRPLLPDGAEASDTTALLQSTAVVPGSRLDTETVPLPCGYSCSTTGSVVQVEPELQTRVWTRVWYPSFVNWTL